MTGRFGKYGDAKRRLKMRKTHRAAPVDLHRAGRKRPFRDARPTRRQDVSGVP
jgi:hypothetical protein